MTASDWNSMNATTMKPSALVSAPATGADQEVRLNLGGSTRPHRFDGTWWPRTRNLVDELPSLIAALRKHGMPVARVAYHLDSWDAAPRRLTIEGQRIRLGGFRYIDPDQLSTTDLYQTVRVDLEVIPEADGAPVEPAAVIG
jgi:hypothetical protein